MTSELPPQQPDDPSAMTGAAAMNMRTSAMYQEGVRQLTDNVASIVETGDPQAVQEYLGDVLADTEGRVPASERLAVFEVLADEQRLEIQRGLLGSAEEMLNNFGNNNTTVRRQLGQAGPAVNRTVRVLLDTHEYEVGRHLRGNQIDTRKAERGQEQATGASRRTLGAITEYVEVLGRWGRAQQSELRHFDDTVRRGAVRERALDEGAQTVDPDYDEGDPKDLSVLIDTKVTEAVAVKLQALVTEAIATGESPADAVLELATQKPNSVTAKVIDDMRAFAGRQAGDIKGSLNRVEGSTAKELERRLKSFATQGLDGYRYARRPEDAADLYRQQQRTLTEVDKDAGFVVRQGASLVFSSDEELQRAQQSLAHAQSWLS